MHGIFKNRATYLYTFLISLSKCLGGRGGGGGGGGEGVEGLGGKLPPPLDETLTGVRCRSDGRGRGGGGALVPRVGAEGVRTPSF